MIKKILEFFHKLRISMKCCMGSECSLNENNINDNNIDDEIAKNYEEFKPK